MHVEYENKRDPNKNRGKWNHSKFGERMLGKEWLGTKPSNERKQPYWALHTHASASTNVKVKNIHHGKSRYMYHNLWLQNSRNII